MRFNTSLLHAGVDRSEHYGATLPPIYQSSAFEQETALNLEHIFENKAPGYCYTRVANPTVTSFENRITKMEGGIASVACASGMAALFNALTNILQSGDELISSASLYGGTIDLFRDLEAFGITTRYVENNNWDEIKNALNDKTKLIFAETIGNPRLDVTDVEKLAEIAHEAGIPLIIDNTTATAYLFQPLKHGISTEAAIPSAECLPSEAVLNGTKRNFRDLRIMSNSDRWRTLQSCAIAFSAIRARALRRRTPF
jgi:O-acetylhomoserine (thiol)-lyase